MFRWVKRRLVAWVEERQRREIVRLHQKTIRIKEEIERTTGEPVQLSHEQRRHLAKKARGIDPEILKRSHQVAADVVRIIVIEFQHKLRLLTDFLEHF